MSKRKFVAAVLVALSALAAVGARASGVIAGATEPTQILNNIQLLSNGMEEARTAATVIWSRGRCRSATSSRIESRF